VRKDAMVAKDEQDDLSSHRMLLLVSRSSKTIRNAVVGCEDY